MSRSPQRRERARKSGDGQQRSTIAAVARSVEADDAADPTDGSRNGQHDVNARWRSTAARCVSNCLAGRGGVRRFENLGARDAAVSQLAEENARRNPLFAPGGSLLGRDRTRLFRRVNHHCPYRNPNPLPSARDTDPKRKPELYLEFACGSILSCKSGRGCRAGRGTLERKFDRPRSLRPAGPPPAQEPGWQADDGINEAERPRQRPADDIRGRRHRNRALGEPETQAAAQQETPAQLGRLP